MLSLGMVLPAMPMLAAHLAAILVSSTVRRLYVTRDDDPAGDVAHNTLRHRADEAGIDVSPLSTGLGDFNDDLRLLSIDTIQAAVRIQLVPQDVGHFIVVADRIR